MTTPTTTFKTFTHWEYGLNLVMPTFTHLKANPLPGERRLLLSSTLPTSSSYLKMFQGFVRGEGVELLENPTFACEPGMRVGIEGEQGPGWQVLGVPPESLCSEDSATTAGGS